MTVNVVVDVDAGSDDAVALLLLLASEQDVDIKVIGVTCTHGNTHVDRVCNNVLLTLETIQRQDVPVFRGAASSLIPLENPHVVHSYFHGADGFGDNDFPPPITPIQNENAIVALNRLASDYQHVTLICLGPLTNVALAFKTFPDFADNVKGIFIMGGNCHGVGNASSSAEFNFATDPEAAHIVLSCAKCPIILLPWEPCIAADVSTKWRFHELGKVQSPQMKLLNSVEERIYETQTIWNPCDAFVAAAFLDNSIITKSRLLHLTVELHGGYTRGQVVVDHAKKKKPNVTVIDDIDFETFKTQMMKMARFEAAK